MTYLIYELTIENTNISEKISVLGYEYFCYMVYKVLKNETNGFVEITKKQITDSITEVFDIIDFNKVRPDALNTGYLDGYLFEGIYNEIIKPFKQRSKLGYNSDDYVILFSETDTSDLTELKINTANI